MDQEMSFEYLLLREVESKPIVWNKQNSNYSDAKKKEKAWKEIFEKVFERFPFLTGIYFVCFF